jgi:hypothetical protein
MDILDFWQREFSRGLWFGQVLAASPPYWAGLFCGLWLGSLQPGPRPAIVRVDPIPGA